MVAKIKRSLASPVFLNLHSHSHSLTLYFLHLHRTSKEVSIRPYLSQVLGYHCSLFTHGLMTPSFLYLVLLSFTPSFYSRLFTIHSLPTTTHLHPPMRLSLTPSIVLVIFGQVLVFLLAVEPIAGMILPVGGPKLCAIYSTSNSALCQDKAGWVVSAVGTVNADEAFGNCEVFRVGGLGPGPTECGSCTVQDGTGGSPAMAHIVLCNK